MRSENGVELDTWLRQKSQVFDKQSNMESLDNMRIFYIVKAAFEEYTNVYKIGISERGAHASKGRLFLIMSIVMELQTKRTHAKESKFI